MKYHPDKNEAKSAHEKFILINEAYAYLIFLFSDYLGNIRPIQELSEIARHNGNNLLTRLSVLLSPL